MFPPLDTVRYVLKGNDYKTVSWTITVVYMCYVSTFTKTVNFIYRLADKIMNISRTHKVPVHFVRIINTEK